MNSAIKKNLSNLGKKIYKIPLLGYGCQILVAIIKLPRCRQLVYALSAAHNVNQKNLKANNLNFKIEQVRTELKKTTHNIHGQINTVKEELKKVSLPGVTANELELLTAKCAEVDQKAEFVKMQIIKIEERFKKIDERFTQTDKKLNKIEEVMPAFLNMLNSSASTLRSFKRELDELRSFAEENKNIENSAENIWENITKNNKVTQKSSKNLAM